MNEHKSSTTFAARVISQLTRRTFLRRAAALLPLPALAGGWNERTPPIRSLAPTAECDDDDDPTPRQTEGPYFSPRSPERRSLLDAGVSGTKLIVAGHVLTTECEPVADALLDFWQADDDGAYDNNGYRLRGHQFTDAEGRFRLETIIPGAYPGRTRHIHVKVQAPGKHILTTQLYFPDEPRNARDRIFNPSLLMDVTETTDGKSAEFDFVLDVT